MSIAPAKHKIPSVISSRLRALRRKLTGWLLVDGISRLLLAIIAIVLFDAVVDRFFKMDFPQRVIMLCVMSAVVIFVLFWRVIKPLFHSISDDALILQVEDKNRDLKENLISSVQFSREAIEQKQGVSKQMVEATIERGKELAKSVNFGNALNSSRRTTNLLLLLVGLAGIGLLAFAVMNTEFWRTWFDRNIMLTNAQWPQATYLLIDGAEDGRKVMKRGEDHSQIVRVDAILDQEGNPTPESRSRITDINVTLEIDTGTSRTEVTMNQVGPLEHQFDFRNVTSEFKFRARGGDDVTPWIRVKLVDPPTVSDLELVAVLPDYTGNIKETLPRGSGTHSILAGSSLEIKATSNKKLASAFLRHSDSEAIALASDDGLNFSLKIPADELVGGKYTFDLTDETGMTSSRPSSFSIKIKEDRAPIVRASLKGIGGLIVPKAVIPISFQVKDEFAVESVDVSLMWRGDSESSVPQEYSEPVSGLDEILGKNVVQAETVYDLRPRNIPTGVGLRLSIKAKDNNSLTGPGEGISREFLLRVVTEEELRADMLRREIELRQAFELALKNQEQLTVDLRALAASHLEQKGENDKVFNQLVEMQRRQKIIGTNLASIADRFEGILIEAENNRLDESESDLDENQTIRKRLNDRIIVPIRELDARDIFVVSKSFDVVRRAVDDPQAMNRAASDTASMQDDIENRMREILAAMQQSETYQQIINQAIETKKDQESVKNMTEKKKQENQNQGIFDDEDGIFDEGGEEEENKNNSDSNSKDSENTEQSDG